MASKLKFNPGFQTDEEAVANYVVRREELEQTLAAFAPKSDGPPRVLVVAPRGAGKTTLCRRVLAETRRSEALGGAWQAIFLGEESYTVTSPGEFFLECIFQVADQNSDAGLHESHQWVQESASEAELLTRCLSVLQSYSDRIGKRLLIIVENFHIILHDQIGGAASSLLSELRNDRLFGVLATSVAQSSAENGGLLHTDFQRINLEPLNLEQCHQLWESLTDASVKPDKIRPLQILTGGSPRLIHILADFMRTPSLQDLLGNLNLLIDQNTEYFKSQLDALPAMERKVFAALLDAWDPATAKQIAESARVNTNIASAMLARLSERGAVVKAPGSGRAAIYYAAERLFNIYYLMRRRSHPSSRVRALVSFMTEYYDRDELVDTTAILVREACTVAPDRRADYHSTFGEIMSRAPEPVRRSILERTPQEFIRSYGEDELARPGRRDLVVSDLEAEFKVAMSEGDHKRAKGLLHKIIDMRPSAGAWTRLSLLCDADSEQNEAIRAAQQAVKLDDNDAWALAALGWALRRANRSDEALAPLQQALRENPRHPLALNELSELWVEKEQPERALAIFDAANAAGPLSDLAQSKHASLLIDQGRVDEAETCLRNAVADDVDNVESRRLLANLLDSVGRKDEAAEVLNKAAERFGAWQHWADLGSFLLLRTDRDDEAAIALRKAIANGGEEALAYRRLAHALFHAKAPASEIVEVRETVLDKLPEDWAAWSAAGFISVLLEMPGQAEADLRRALELGGGHEVKRQLARLIEGLPGRRAEAGAILREIAEESPNCSAARDLAEFLVHEGQDAQAEAITESVTSKTDCFCNLVIRGQICERRGDKGMAETQFRKALELAEDGVPALIGLANLVPPAEAEALIARALETDPSDPSCLLARATLGRADFETQKQYANEALAADPEFIEAHLHLARVEAQLGNAENALDHLDAALELLPNKKEHIPSFVSSSMLVSQTIDDDRLERRLAEHLNALTVEPLTVALRLKRKENPMVAKEVLEVAKDILRNHPSGMATEDVCKVS